MTLQLIAARVECQYPTLNFADTEWQDLECMLPFEEAARLHIDRALDRPSTSTFSFICVVLRIASVFDRSAPSILA